MVMCLGQGADLHMAQLMPLPFTISCSSKSRLVLPFWFRLTVKWPSWILSGTTRVSQHQKGKTNHGLLEQGIVSNSVPAAVTKYVFDTGRVTRVGVL